MFRSIIGKALAAAVALGLLAGAAQAGGVFYKGLPEGAAHKLKELIANDSHVKCIAFSSTGGWVILYDDSSFFAKGIPDDAFAKLKELSENGVTLKWIAFTPSDGFVILANKGGFFATKDVPTAAVRRLKAASDNGDDLKSMTFTGKNGWVLIEDGAFWADGLPREPYQQLQKSSVAGEHIKSIAFTPAGGWAVLVNRDGAWDMGIPDAAMEKIDLLQKLGNSRFNCIAFPPNSDGTWVLIVD
jgi:hypothetical protein